MPSCSATRRASYTSSSEQQRPVAPSEESSGNRRWFHSCIVSPTMGWPWRARSAATVELSTPPLMATAIEASGMDGDSAQVRGGLGDRFGKGIDLFGGIGTAEREPHARTGALTGEADGGENVRRRD